MGDASKIVLVHGPDLSGVVDTGQEAPYHLINCRLNCLPVNVIVDVEGWLCRLGLLWASGYFAHSGSDEDLAEPADDCEDVD